MTQFDLAVAAAIAVQSVAPQAFAPGAATVPDDGTLVAHLGRSTYVDFEAGAGYGTNPQLRAGDSQDQAFGRASAHLVHTIKSERISTILSAYGENISYTGDGNSQQLVSISAHHDAQVQEHLSLFGDLSGSLNTGGQLGTRFVGVPDGGVLTGPIVGPSLPSPDVTFLNADSRQYLLNGQVGLVAQVNPRDTLSVSGSAEYGFSRGGFRSHYTDVSGLLGSDRRLNERWTIGGRVRLERANYSTSVDSTIVTPQATAHYQLSERWTAFGAVGVSVANVRTKGISDNSVGLALDAGLCSQGESTNWCAHVARSQQRATTIGPVKLLSADLDYSRQLDAKQSVQISAGVSHSTSSGPTLLTTAPFTRITYFSAAASYTRELHRRLFGGVNVSARKYIQAGPDPKTDLSASIFLRYRLGDLQ